MKKIFSFIILVLSITFVSGCGVSNVIKCMGKDKLVIYNWGEYMADDVIDEFEKEYDVCVKYYTFPSNEEAINKMKTDSYDIVIPSDYAIEQMVQEDMIKDIDWSKVIDKDGNAFNKDLFTSSMLEIINDLNTGDNAYDYLKHAVPYYFGSVGIVYDTTKVTKELLEEKQWDIFKEPDLRAVYYDSSRDGFIAPLKSLGKSLNPSSDDIDAASSWLEEMIEIHPNMPFLTDQLLDDLPNYKYDISIVYSGDATYVLSEDTEGKLDFFKPSATNVWVDGIVIPKKVKNEELAYKFISFLLREDVNKTNTLEIGYTSVLQSVYDDLSTNDFKDYSSFKVEVSENDQTFRYLGADLKKKIDESFELIKIKK